MAIPEPVFIVRAERGGAHEEFNFREGVSSISWNDYPNPFRRPYEDLVAHAERQRVDPDDAHSGAPRMIWTFAHEPDLDRALIVLPRLASQHLDDVAVGWCESTAYRVEPCPDDEPNLRRRTRWIATDLPRRAFSEATQSRFNHPRNTVSRVKDADVVGDIFEVLARLGLVAGEQEGEPQ